MSCATSERDRERKREMVEIRKKLIESKKTGERMVYCIVTNDLIFPSFWQTGIVNLFSVFTCHNYNIHGGYYVVGPDRWVECFLHIGQTNFNLILMNITVCDVR